MRKRILSILLTLCMVLCLIPTAVFAEGAPTGTPLTQALLGTWLEKEDPYNPNSGKIYKMPSGNYYLAEDIYLVGDDADTNSAWPLIISEGAVTLDLNGHVLDLKRQNISIYLNGNLTLTDSSPEAEHKFRVEDSGLWVLDETQGTKTVAGGVITGGTGVDDGTAGILGGGVSVSYGSLTMNGGSIVGCTANNGGGVSVYGGSFTMNSGRIAGCTAVKSGNAYGNGGGVYVGDLATFNMNDGSIVDCTADTGGVFVDGLATFTMNDGSIVGCTADIGGGVYMGGWAEFNMTGGSIESCTADNGGGVYVGSGARFEMNSGSEGKDPTIKNCIAVRAGGGVFVEANIYSDDGTFTMTGGSIANCTAGDAANAVHADGNFTDNRTSKIDKSLVSGINAGHTGSETDPILIGSAEGLKNFRDKVNNGQTGLCATLLCDIVLNDGTFDADGTYTGANGSTSAEQWTPISNFYRGTFDGNGKTIRGLYINGLNEHCGLFGLCGRCTIRNLTVTGYVCASADRSVGGIVGLASPSAYITNCQNSCTVKGGNRVGGIAGAASSNAHISGCSNSGRISGIAAVGGIVGDLWGISVIKNCSNIGAVTGTGDAVYVGGLAGRSSDSEISNSYSVGALSGSGNQVYVGGIAGEMSGGNGRITYSCWLEDTAEEAAGYNTVFKDVYARSKFDFADSTVLKLLQNGDADSPWTKTDYLAAAGMTLPLLSWQTADAHTHDYQWKYDNTEHWKECSCGFIEQGSKTAHEEVTGICTDGIKCACGYEMHTATGGHSYPTNWSPVRPGSTHEKACTNPGCGVMQSNSCTGGTATCTEQATCEVCGEKYGTTDLNNHSYEWQNENGQYWQKCKLCDFETDKKDIPTITITGSDRVCRSQDYTFSFTLPEGATDAEWGYEFINLAGGPITPTLENGRYYGVMDSDYYSKSENSFRLIVSGVTADGFELRAEKIVAVLDAHTGGTATCTAQAVCEVCGESYGELDSNNHADMKHIEAKAATKTAEGNIEYWYCEGCGKYFADKDGNKKITKADTVTAKLPEEKPTSPKTGDTNNLALWIALLFISGGIITVTTVVSKKKRHS